MLYIVYGVPRSGKSTIRQKMYLQGVSGIGTDDLTSLFQNAAPQLDIAFGKGNKHNSERLWSFILELGAQFTRNYEDYLVEGDAFDLETLKNINDKNIKICFLGNKDIDIKEKFENIKKYRLKGDWTFMHTDEEILSKVEKWKEKSRELEIFAKENNIKYFDSSENFQETIDEVIKYLVKS